MSPRPVLVTGAAGKTGRAVIRALAARGDRIRGLVRRPEQAAELEAQGEAETIAGDLLDPDALARACAGTRAVYHICPNLHPAEAEIGRAAIEAARAAGVERFAFHSVLHPQIEAMPHHWRKLRVEEALIESGLPFTILQPAAYMQNVLGRLAEIAETGRHRVPYPVETRLCLVD
ncbi:MAG: NmrA family NAD(P)-binding protein, partial [Gemmatimonadota bacterium]